MVNDIKSTERDRSHTTKTLGFCIYMILPQADLSFCIYMICPQVDVQFHNSHIGVAISLRNIT